MLLAILEFTDLAILVAIVVVFSGGMAASPLHFRRGDRDRQERVEQKLDLILAHLGLAYTPPVKADWQQLAADPSQKITAIKAYREREGTSLAEAKRVVEEYIAGGSHHA